MTSTLSLPVVELEESDGGEPDVAEAAVPGMGAHAHFDSLIRERGRQHLNRARIGKAFKKPRIRFPAWRADTTFQPARLQRLPESIPGLLKRL